MQFFKEKIICKICITIIVILILQLIISNLLFFPKLHNYSFAVNTIILIGTAFTIFAFFINWIRKNKIQENSELSNLKFKRNYTLFKDLLLKEGKIVFNHNLFYLGSVESNIHISLIYSLNCIYCAESFQKLKKSIDKYSVSDNVSFEIRFNLNSDIHPNHESLKIIHTFKKLYEKSETDFLNGLQYWYIEKNSEMFFSKFPFERDNDNEALNDIFLIGKENSSNNINYTPILLINGYKFPALYENSDILYFIEELIDDELSF